MLTPADKVYSGGNDIIQIVVTRRCDIFNCSNCTQMLPFRADSMDMSLDCIEKALISVQDWPGVVAAFGGNCCLHPQFPEVAKLWARYVPEQRRRGLWTNNLMSHAVIVRDVWYPYGRFNLNVHGNLKAAAAMRDALPKARVFGERPSHHGAVFGDRAKLGVTDERWGPIREGCDINRNWSAGVYQGPDGDPVAYFCEVAGAIDGVTGERNGVPAVPGWWKQPIADFRNQVTRCCDKHCLVPLRLKGHDDLENTYTTTAGSPLLTVGRKGKVSVHEIAAGGETIRELTDYQHLRGNG